MAPHAAQLMSAWSPAGPARAHARLAVLLAAIDGSDRSGETLGQRNCRLLRLHRELVGTPLEAHVACAQCGVDNEFVVPADAILASPAPAPDARVRVRSRGRILSFRLPCMADIAAANGGSNVREVQRAVLEQCRVGGEPALMTAAAAERLGRAFEFADPAANIVVQIACSGCHAALAASVDVAAFVARDLDRLVDAIYREVHTIASVYGWDETTILALPPERRRRYIRMIAAAAPPRPRPAQRTR